MSKNAWLQKPPEPPLDYVVLPSMPFGGIVLRSIPGRYEMETAAPFEWVGPDITVRIPKHYVFDGASIPRPFWRVVGSPWGPYRDAAAVHDYLYSHGHKAYPEVTRKQADKYFRQIMLEVGIGKTLAAIMYRAVRVGGWRGWNRARNASDRRR